MATGSNLVNAGISEIVAFLGSFAACNYVACPSGSTPPSEVAASHSFRGWHNDDLQGNLPCTALEP